MTDLECEAITQAEVLKDDHADTKALSERAASAVQVVNRIVADDEDVVLRGRDIEGFGLDISRKVGLSLRSPIRARTESCH